MIFKHATLLILLTTMLGCAPWHGISGKSTGFDSSPANRFQSTLTDRQQTEVRLHTADALEREGHLREAISLYEAVRQSHPERHDITPKLAVLHSRLHNDERATNEFQRAVKENPKDADVLSNYGFFLAATNQPRDADLYLREALKIDADHAQAKTNLAILLAQEGKTQESLQFFTDVVGEAAAFSNLGMIFAKQQKNGQAVAAFDRALRLNPSLDKAKSMRAYLLEGQ